MLKDILDDKREETVQKYLEDNKKILIAAFGMPEWYYNIVIPKFRFGSNYVSDFVIITGQSYSYWINLVELEPPTVNLFTREGDYAKRLNHAIKQVDEWKDWINKYENYFKDSLVQAIKSIDSSFDESFDYTRRFIISKSIVIGRRSTLSSEDNKRRVIEREKSGLDIATYDRLVDVENRIMDIENRGGNFKRFEYDD